MLGLFKWLETAFPKITAKFGDRPANLVFGIMAVVTTAVLSFGLQEPIVRLAYKLHFLSLSDLPIPAPLKIILGILILDFIQYVNHALCHRFQILWRIHKVHHSDMFISASTGLLHHPFEVIWGFCIVVLVSVALGIPVGSLLIYGAIDAVHGIFSHSNLRLPRSVDRALGYILFTPDLHRIHHSIDMVEGNSNFGQVLSIWDRLFGTYIDAPALGFDQFVAGRADIKKEDLDLIPLVIAPLKK